MNRPKGLLLTTTVLVVCNTLGWLVIDYTSSYAATVFLVVTLLAAVEYAVIYFYWKGKNWARILILIGSFCSIFNLRYWNAPHTMFLTVPNRVILAANAVTSLFLIYWLNTSEIKAFFKRSKKAQSIPAL